jgi:thiamine pyrophosphokinase
LLLAHDLIIAADGGGRTVLELGLQPDLVVGDLDSLSGEAIGELRRRRVPFVEFPREKDKTDSQLSLEEAIARGANEITLTGAWGGRFDQALANVFLLRWAVRQGVVCRITEEGGEISLVDRHLVVAGGVGDTVSLLPLEPCRGVELDGFRYSVPAGRLDPGSTLGVSNELVKKLGKIDIASGSLLVVRIR